MRLWLYFRPRLFLGDVEPAMCYLSCVTGTGRSQYIRWIYEAAKEVGASRGQRCPVCGAETDPGDSFCQDCGYKLEVRARTDPESRPPAAFWTCLNCGRQQEPGAQLCSHCGSTMADVGVFTTSRARAIKPGSASSGTGEELPLVSQPTPDVEAAAQRKVFSSPILERSIQGARPAGGTYGAGSLARPLVDLSIAMLITSFFALMIWWLVDSEVSRSPFSFKEALIQAQAAIGARKYSEAIFILEKVSISRDGKLSEDESKALDEALYQRACEAEKARSYKLALSDLLRISPAFLHFEDARKRIGAISAIIEDAGVKAPVVASGRGNPQKDPLPLAGKNPELAAITANTAAKIEAPAAGAKTGAESEASPPDSGYSLGGFAVDDERLPAGPRFVAARGASEGQESPESEIARYNKLLADYFSSSRSRTRKTIKDEFGVSGDGGEPPSFREWVERGKPDF